MKRSGCGEHEMSENGALTYVDREWPVMAVGAPVWYLKRQLLDAAHSLCCTLSLSCKHPTTTNSSSSSSSQVSITRAENSPFWTNPARCRSSWGEWRGAHNPRTWSRSTPTPTPEWWLKLRVRSPKDSGETWEGSLQRWHRWTAGSRDLELPGWAEMVRRTWIRL